MTESISHVAVDSAVGHKPCHQTKPGHWLVTLFVAGSPLCQLECGFDRVKEGILSSKNIEIGIVVPRAAQGGSLICEATAKGLAPFCRTTIHSPRSQQLVAGHCRQQFAGLFFLCDSRAALLSEPFLSSNGMLLKPLPCPEALWKVAQSLPLRASCLNCPLLLPNQVHIGSRLGTCTRR